MSRLTRRVAVRTKGAAAKTYAEWVAHVNGRSQPAVWGAGGGGNSLAPDTYRAIASNDTGSMSGSTWQAVYFSGYSTPCRMIQHAMPSEAQYRSQQSNAAVILFTVTNVGRADEVGGVLRNGYASLSDGFPGFNGLLGGMTMCAWWDFALSKPQMNNPSSGTAPVDYAAPGW